MAGAQVPITTIDTRFDRWAGLAALAGAALAIVYSVAFVVLANKLLYSAALTAGSLLSAIALFAVYGRVRAAGPLAQVGMIFALAGVTGAAIHGAFDLADAIHPEAASNLVGPHPLDPRGFLTFGLAGLGILLLSWAGLGLAGLQRPLLYLGLLFGILLLVVYFGRLIVLDPKNVLVLGPAGLTGLIVGPLWYAWFGWLLLTRRA
jgi:hypothetical protein